jgi:hypothetical protein
MQRGEGMAQRERKKRGKRKYGQAKLKHAKRGIISCGLSAGVFLMLVIYHLLHRDLSHILLRIRYQKLLSKLAS